MRRARRHVEALGSRAPRGDGHTMTKSNRFHPDWKNRGPQATKLQPDLQPWKKIPRQNAVEQQDHGWPAAAMTSSEGSSPRITAVEQDHADDELGARGGRWSTRRPAVSACVNCTVPRPVPRRYGADQPPSFKAAPRGPAAVVGGTASRTPSSRLCGPLGDPFRFRVENCAPNGRHVGGLEAPPRGAAAGQARRGMGDDVLGAGRGSRRRRCRPRPGSAGRLEAARHLRIIVDNGCG